MAQSATSRFDSHIRLDSWKAVAGYLGCSPRTAQRWLSEYGLPVRRVGGGSGRVFAYVDELDAWLRSHGSSLTDTQPASTALGIFATAWPDTASSVAHVAGSCVSVALAAHDRSCELVTFAEKIWNTLSALDLGVITRLYREAIDSNPENPGAYAGIAITLIAGGLFGNITASSSSAAARFALQQAVGFDSGQVEVPTARAWIRLVLDHDRHGARADFDAALGQRWSFGPAVVGRALLHIADGQLADAAILLQDFTAQYPLSAPAMVVRCWVDYLTGDAAAARNLIAQMRRAGLTGSLLDALEALAIITSTVPEKRIELLQVLAARWPVDCPHRCLLQAALGYCYAATGRDQDAHNILHNLASSAAEADTEVAYPLALVALGLNDHSAAVHWLKESYCAGSLWSLAFEVDPILGPLRSASLYRPLARGVVQQESEALNVQSVCIN